MGTDVLVSVPTVRRLKIERFRGLETLDWSPDPRVNIILGGGDIGKTTILDAVALLLSPTNWTVISEADYWLRDVPYEFSIEAVIALPLDSAINTQSKPTWPWHWDGQDAVLPKADDNDGPEQHTYPVYRLRVRGTSDFDLQYEIMQPNNEADNLSVAIRRSIGLVRLGGDDRNDRDLRLIQGSALDRLLSDKTLRARLGQKLASQNIGSELQPNAKNNLTKLDKVFQQKQLPTGLSVGFTGNQGISFNALVGLTAKKASVELPLSSWGAGTRRLAALEIAAANQAENPIVIVDEVERGLEPYRQRSLIGDLISRQVQVFLTTHSVAALAATSDETAIWRMQSNGQIFRLPRRANIHIRKDPEAYLARLTVIAEGPTEVGFLRYLLQEKLQIDLLNSGIWISDGGGNEKTLNLLEDLHDSKLIFGAFVDNEGNNSGRWRTLREGLGAVLFQWPVGCLESNIIEHIANDRLEEFILDPDGESGERLRTLADRLNMQDKDFGSIRDTAPNIKTLIIDAATGSVPADMGDLPKSEKRKYSSHGRVWFKTEAGGLELAHKMFNFDVWPKVQPLLQPFLDAVKKYAAVDLSNRE